METINAVGEWQHHSGGVAALSHEGAWQHRSHSVWGGGGWGVVNVWGPLHQHSTSPHSHRFLVSDQIKNLLKELKERSSFW